MNLWQVIIITAAALLLWMAFWGLITHLTARKNGLTGNWFIRGFLLPGFMTAKAMSPAKSGAAGRKPGAVKGTAVPGAAAGSPMMPGQFAGSGMSAQQGQYQGVQTAAQQGQYQSRQTSVLQQGQYQGAQTAVQQGQYQSRQTSVLQQGQYQGAQMAAQQGQYQGAQMAAQQQGQYQGAQTAAQQGQYRGAQTSVLQQGQYQGAQTGMQQQGQYRGAQTPAQQQSRAQGTQQGAAWQEPYRKAGEGVLSGDLMHSSGQTGELSRKPAAPASEAKKNPGGWRCVCGRVNYSYISTCACGRKRADQQPAAEAGNPQPGGKTAKAVPAGPMDEQSRMKALRDLKALLDEGIITQQEFEAKKKSYLGF